MKKYIDVVAKHANINPTSHDTDTLLEKLEVLYFILVGIYIIVSIPAAIFSLKGHEIFLIPWTPSIFILHYALGFFGLKLLAFLFAKNEDVVRHITISSYFPFFNCSVFITFVLVFLPYLILAPLCAALGKGLIWFYELDTSLILKARNIVPENKEKQ